LAEGGGKGRKKKIPAEVMPRVHAKEGEGGMGRGRSSKYLFFSTFSRFMYLTGRKEAEGGREERGGKKGKRKGGKRTSHLINALSFQSLRDV